MKLQSTDQAITKNEIMKGIIFGEAQDTFPSSGFNWFIRSDIGQA